MSTSSELYGKFAYYDANSHTPGGLMVAQYKTDPFQNIRLTDYRSGERKGVDLGYINTISNTQEFQVHSYYNDSTRVSALINAARTQIVVQP